jgi:hypothetical protein
MRHTTNYAWTMYVLDSTIRCIWQRDPISRNEGEKRSGLGHSRAL